MQWHSPSRGDYLEEKSQWHSYFAILPVWAYGARKMLWLETVQRRLRSYSSYADIYDWEYKPMEKK